MGFRFLLIVAPLGLPSAKHRPWSKLRRNDAPPVWASWRSRRNVLILLFVSPCFRTECTEECLYQLNLIHQYYRRKIILVWDNLSAHHAAVNYFGDEHSNEYDFYFFPTYSPELNPVEPCWHHTKNVEMANFAAKDKEEMVRKLFESTQKISDDQQLLASFFKHAGLKLRCDFFAEDQYLFIFSKNAR